MDVKNCYQGIDKYAVWLVRRRARYLVGKAGFTEADREDLEQEMLTDLLCRLPQFNSNRAQRKTFIAKVIEHKFITLIEAQKAGIRDYRLCNGSLNEYLEDEDGKQMERQETISQDGCLQRAGRCSRPLDELAALSIEIRKIMAELPPNLRELFERLQNETVTEISQTTGIPRGSIYDSIKKFRLILENAGLKNYL